MAREVYSCQDEWALEGRRLSLARGAPSLLAVGVPAVTPSSKGESEAQGNEATSQGHEATFPRHLPCPREALGIEAAQAWTLVRDRTAGQFREWQEHGGDHSRG